jgi:beta-glucanase (GH16 family)
MSKGILYSISCFFLLFTACSNLSEIEQDKAWILVWSDEFDEDGLPNPERWTFDEGDGCPALCGWGNKEAQYYQKGELINSRVENGILIIEAHKDSMGDAAFTSARIKSTPSGVWKYGKFEIKARLPKGRGVWPAIWMLPEEWVYGSWPKSGEIDIMEHVGFASDTIYGAVHTELFNHAIKTEKAGQIFAKDVGSDFQVYSVIWEEDFIDFQMNDSTYFTFTKESNDPDKWPFDQAFHLILNLAVGGNWGGREGIDNSIWPQRFEIDYVRVYQR